MLGAKTRLIVRRDELHMMHETQDIRRIAVGFQEGKPACDDAVRGVVVGAANRGSGLSIGGGESGAGVLRFQPVDNRFNSVNVFNLDVVLRAQLGSYVDVG